MAVKPIPEGYHSVTPYLAVEGADKLLEFLKRAFDAADTHICMKRDDGTIQHAEVKIGDSIVMLAEASGPWEPMPSVLYLYVNDVDATYQRSARGGCNFADGAGDPLLRRPERWGTGSRGKSLVDRYPRRGRLARGAPAASRRGEEEPAALRRIRASFSSRRCLPRGERSTHP
jgi:Glyoxalase/Bleomycin resistance protein/Dioxygenase superfamily